MLIGEYHHNIDEKKRLIIPVKFRDDLGDKFIITRGLDECLFCYSLEQWDKIVSKLEKLSFTKKDARMFMRFFFSSATVCEFDKQGRIVIVNSLVEYANLKKECVIIGVNDRLEIWSLDKLTKMMNDNLDNYANIAENLFMMGENDVT